MTTTTCSRVIVITITIALGGIADIKAGSSEIPKNTHMNKNILTVAFTSLALVSFGQLATAHQEDEDNSQYDEHQHHDGGRLNSELDHLNQMLDHVQGEMRRYGADRHIWSEYQHVRDEARRLNRQFQRGEQFYNRRQLRAEVEHMHNELHHIEQELHARAEEWYQWR